jgi:hypothetical protein
MACIIAGCRNPATNNFFCKASPRRHFGYLGTKHRGVYL